MDALSRSSDPLRDVTVRVEVTLPVDSTDKALIEDRAGAREAVADLVFEEYEKCVERVLARGERVWAG